MYLVDCRIGGVIKMRGKLIFLFGIDGSGKSTMLEMLKNSKLKNTIYTSCMKNAIFEEELYKAEAILHFSRSEVFSHEFKHVLHIGSVIYNMYDKIIPVLNNGKNVILDRYTICIKQFTDLFLKPSYNCLSKALDCLPTPDLGIYLDVEIETAVKRIEQRSIKTGIPPHYSESKKALIMKQTTYETQIPNEAYPIVKIDANKCIDEVYLSILNILNEVYATTL